MTASSNPLFSCAVCLKRGTDFFAPVIAAKIQKVSQKRSGEDGPENEVRVARLVEDGLHTVLLPCQRPLSLGRRDGSRGCTSGSGGRASSWHPTLPSSHQLSKNSFADGAFSSQNQSGATIKRPKFQEPFLPLLLCTLANTLHEDPVNYLRATVIIPEKNRGFCWESGQSSEMR